MSDIKFSDPELQRRYERTVSTLSILMGLPEELWPVFALMDAYDLFKHLEGEDSDKVRDIIQKLTSPELRPALRLWYQDPMETMNASAAEFRQRLSGLVGETL
ncbi:hypothetical protein [Brevifollis gellanilyticus]|uniref:Uncharacterized protein n=1 Tax=Brevifollis gellanilyticus TaxID=748831 RepID=A0A512M6M6_9BACT|nr:hypothetical protein [Brevifollis gellanilyticus]GEP42373.1 hypothetical protein BGE01nite_16640 [Brevifollis gellanilyticus]